MAPNKAIEYLKELINNYRHHINVGLSADLRTF